MIQDWTRFDVNILKHTKYAGTTVDPRGARPVRMHRAAVS